MGTSSSYTADEWIELYNPGSDAVDLSGWHIAAADGNMDIILSGTIQAGGYYLIERTDDSTVSDVAADLAVAFGAGLGDSGEYLKLTRPDGTLADEVDCSGGWFAGDKTMRASMERISSTGSGSQPTNWASNDGSVTIGHDAAGGAIRGTPRGQNSVTP